MKDISSVTQVKDNGWMTTSFSGYCGQIRQCGRTMLMIDQFHQPSPPKTEKDRERSRRTRFFSEAEELKSDINTRQLFY